MTLFSLLNILVFALYLSGSLLILAGRLRNLSGPRRAGNALAIAGFSLHTIDLAASILTVPSVQHLAYFYFSLFAWLLLLIYFILWWRLKIGFLSLTAAPLALLLFTSSFAFTHVRVTVPKEASALFYGLHIGSIYLSSALMALAFGAGLAFIYMEKKIKSKEKLSGIGKEMPSLSTFDRVNHFAAVIGFPLYTLGLLSGFIWSGLTRGQVVTWHPREITALAGWFIFALLFHQRLALGWRGRKPARLAIILFVFTILSMLLVNLYFPTHHSITNQGV